jgi:multiple sugar transport system substrate-binding protein
MSHTDDVRHESQELGRLPEDLPDGLEVFDHQMSRRSFLKTGVLAGMTLGGLGGLGAAAAACGSSSSSASSAPSGTVTKYGGSGVADRAVAGARALPNASNISLLVVTPSGTAANFDPFYAQWKANTGISIKTLEIAQNSWQDKLFAAAVAKTPSWDVVVPHPLWFGDLLASGAIKDSAAWAAKYNPLIHDPTYGITEPMASYACYYGKALAGISDDEDIFTLMARSDLLNDPKEQQNFETKYGYDLALATTWDEFRDQAEFFTRKPNLWGAAEQYGKSFTPWWWEPRFASMALPNQYFFDDNMHPQLESPGGIKATELMNALRPFMPPDIVGWNYTQVYSLFAAGNVFQTNTWPALSKFAGDPSTSKVAGKVAYGLIPGTKINGTLNRRSTYAFGNSLSVWGYGANPEAAYLFIQWITSPELMGKSVAAPGYLDPTRYNTFTDPAVVKVYDAKFLPVLLEQTKTTCPDIMLRGALQYYNELDTNLLASFVGDLGAEQAMAKTAAAWEKITDTLGRQTQMEAWASLKTFYPK